MTRKELEKVYYLKRELKTWERRHEELLADMAQDSVSNDGLPHSITNNINRPTENKAILIADHADLIRGKLAEIRLAIREVEAFIVNIEDPLTRHIVELRCVYCMTWEEVAATIGTSNTAENARQIYCRFLKDNLS